MNLAILFSAVTVIATALGGILALKASDRFHLVLGLSAGLLLGLVGFDLWPEVFEMNKSTFGGVPAVAVAILVGFLSLHLIEGLFGGHEPAESDYGHDHEHHNVAGAIGAIAMGGHIFLDGIALGVAFQVSKSLGVAVFLAVLFHAFSDGLNTVSLMVKSGHWNKNSVVLLGVDAIARISGAAFGAYIALSESLMSVYLALFSGVLIYLATSHILPEAHSRHSSRWTFVSTLLGVATMWVIVATLG
jgi:ZIP family zinc transporter